MENADSDAAAGLSGGPAEDAAEPLVKNLLDEAALPRTGDPRHAHHHPEGDVDVDLFEVVRGRLFDPDDALRIEGAAPGGDFYPRRAREVAPGEGPRVREETVEAAPVDDLPATPSRARAHVKDVVRAADDLRIVLDDDRGVPALREAAEDREEAARVPRMEPHRGLVEDVERVHQAGTEGGGEIYPLGFARRERARLAAEREVVEADVREVPEAAQDLLPEKGGGLVLFIRDAERREEAAGVADGKVPDVGDREPVHAVEKPLLPESLPPARGAGGVGAVAGKEDPDVQPVGPALEPFEKTPDAVVVTLPIENEFPVLRGEPIERDIRRDAATGAEGEGIAVPLAVGRGVERLERSVPDGFLRIGDHRVEVDADGPAEAAARGACAERAVEGEQVRGGIGVGDVALRAVEGAGEFPRRSPGAEDRHFPRPVVERLLDRAGEAGAGSGDERQSVRDDLNLPARRFGASPGADLHDRAVRVAPDEPELREFLRHRAGALFGDPEGEADARLLPGPRGVKLAGDELGRFAPHRPAAGAAVEEPDPREEEFQIVVDLGHRPDGRAGALHPRGAVDGDRRGDPVDQVRLRLVHPVEELAGVGGEALDVAALPLGVEGIEGEGRLARAAHPGDDGERVERQVERDVLEVMLACAANTDAPARSGTPVTSHDLTLSAREGWSPH